MKKQTTVTMVSIPAWTHQGVAPGVLTFFESIALAGLEEIPIRLSSADQRKLLGAVVFGRREITVRKEGTVEGWVSTAFGQDAECAIWCAGTIRRAAEAGLQLRPGTSGSGYFDGGEQSGFRMSAV